MNIVINQIKKKMTDLVNIDTINYEHLRDGYGMED